MRMSDGSAKPVIFISYSHRDEPDKSPGGETWWLTYVQSHLQPAVKGDIFELWTDYDIDGGADWRTAIDKKLNDCDIFILLVSRHSVSSDFICGVEVDRMLARRRESELTFYPIVLSPFATSTVPWLMGMNLMPRGGKPLSTLANADRDVAMVEIVEEIAAKAKQIAGRKTASQAPFPIRARTTDSATSLSVRPATVDIAHLPETAYENLVGREVELKRLNDAWADRNANILSLVAEGGAGKSALVNEWLKRMRAENYRDAEAVLGWSFYSQGTKERATSAEQLLNWAVGKLGIEIETTSAIAKGEAIAEALMIRRVLLVLDGCEPLQHGLDKQQGELKDQGLRALLRRFAATPPDRAHGLVVLTSRSAIKDIARWEDGSAPVERLDKLSDEAGAALLRDNGVWGTDKELQAASCDFGGHALALGLLASYLKEKYFGDVRQRGRIRGLLRDEENPRHDHARRVMESYEREWLAAEPVEHAIVHMVGLFDRPASGGCLRALRGKPAIVGLTDAIVDLDECEWQRAVARLRDARLLAPKDPSAPGALDAHPLVREWFGERLKQTNEAAWKAAHGRLYEHLRDTTDEGETPTLQDLEPLYQAIVHGCSAARYEDALRWVLRYRIYRATAGYCYAFHKLGAYGTTLAAIFHFFKRPYEEPVRMLNSRDQSWLLGETAFCLQAQGRAVEAIDSQVVSFRMAEADEDWGIAAHRANNLSHSYLITGEISAAIAIVKQSMEYGKRIDGWRRSPSLRIHQSTLAAALHASGRREKAELAFEALEHHLKATRSAVPTLLGVVGYRFWDLLIDKGNYQAARMRAEQSRKVTGSPEMSGLTLLDGALESLIIARANLGQILRYRKESETSRESTKLKNGWIDDAVERLRVAGQINYVPQGLLARAASCRITGDWTGAMRDLDEVEEIAVPGQMRLFLCDMALDRTRLAFAMIEAFAPLHGIIEGPPKPVAPDATESARLKEEAAKHLAVAADYIKTCGYHRRDEGLAELQAVLRGERKFADLPPRV
jgi:TIR domain